MRRSYSWSGPAIPGVAMFSAAWPTGVGGPTRSAIGRTSDCGWRASEGRHGPERDRRFEEGNRFTDWLIDHLDWRDGSGCRAEGRQSLGVLAQDAAPGRLVERGQ